MGARNFALFGPRARWRAGALADRAGKL